MNKNAGPSLFSNLRIKLKQGFLFALAILSLTLASQAATNYYMTKAGAGYKTGVDWNNAFAITSLSTVLNSTMVAGDTLYLEGANYGNIVPVINSSGTSTARKSLIGVDRGAGLPLFKGPGASPTNNGQQFTINSGKSYWTIKNIRIESRFMGLVASGGNAGLILDGVSTYDTYHRGMVFTNCDDLLVQNCRAEHYAKMGFFCANSCDRVTFKFCYTNCSGFTRGSAEDIAWRSNAVSPVGFNFHISNDTNPPNTDILLEDCESRNNDEDTATVGDYEQGDGFKCEPSNQNVTLRRCISQDNQDGAYDLKGTGQVLEDCVGLRSREGFKVWFDGTLNNCVAVKNGIGFQIPSTTSVNTIYANHCTFHCGSGQVGINADNAAKTADLKDCIISFDGAAGNYTEGPGTVLMNGTTVRLANTSNTSNSPQYINPILTWDGRGNDFDNQTYGDTKGYHSNMPPIPQSVTMDNTDSTGVAIAGTWTSSTGTAGYYGADYINDGNTGKGSSKYVLFTPSIPADGSYEVFVRWTSGTNRASNVPIDVTHAAGTDSFTANQRFNGGIWNSLGVFTFSRGISGSLKIGTLGTNGYVVADAVKFVPFSPTDLIMDNSDSSGVEIAGTWSSSTVTPGYYGADYINDGNTGKGAGKYVTFTPNVPTAGYYELFARWTAGTNRASNVPIEINHSDGNNSFTVDQRSNGGNWFSLGVYRLEVSQGAYIKIGTTGTDGYVIADACRFLYVSP